MSVHPNTGNGKITVPEILSRKRPSADPLSNRCPITSLTAYDYPTARLLDEAGVDIILVGDSLGMVVLGYENTLPVTMEEMLHHTRAVRRGVRRALVVADMPLGGFRVQGKTKEAADQLVRDAHAVEAAGAFSIVLESVPREIAARITQELRIPTIGIGAGPECDGQVLVFHDLVGLTQSGVPKFARRYANLAESISRAAREYCDDVHSGRFPSDAESYHLPAEVRERWMSRSRA